MLVKAEMEFDRAEPYAIELVETMLIDYAKRWGDGMEIYDPLRARGFKNRKTGIWYRVVWAMLLDPRLKDVVDDVIPKQEQEAAWFDVEQEVL